MRRTRNPSKGPRLGDSGAAQAHELRSTGLQECAGPTGTPKPYVAFSSITAPGEKSAGKPLASLQFYVGRPINQQT